MANLSVNNKVLRYKSTSYQISQITSAKPLPEKKTPRKIEQISLNPLKPALTICFVFAAIGLILLSAGTAFGLLAILVSIVCILYSYNLYSNHIEAKNADPYNYMYGISLRMSNGDDPVFYSSNKTTIYGVLKAIESAMNGDENVSISFDNANINISNSNDFDIGNFKNDKD